MVGQAVEVDQGERVEGNFGSGRDGRALRAADDGSGKMEVGGAGPATWQDEAPQRLQRIVHFVHLALEPVDLRLHDPQRHLARREVLARGGEIGAEVEEFVLHRAQHRRVGRIRDVKQGDADGAVGFVDIADRLRPRMRLGDARPVGEAGGAGVAGARVDPVEPDQLYDLPPATIRNSTTRTMAIAW